MKEGAVYPEYIGVSDVSTRSAEQMRVEAFFEGQPSIMFDEPEGFDIGDPPDLRGRSRGWTPVHAQLAALAGCTSIDASPLSSARAVPPCENPDGGELVPRGAPAAAGQFQSFHQGRSLTLPSLGSSAGALALRTWSATAASSGISSLRYPAAMIPSASMAAGEPS